MKASKWSLQSVLVLGLAWGLSSHAQTLTNVYSTAGTTNFLVPAGVTQVVVQAWGGGGGGHDGTFSGERPGGGGGAFAQSAIPVIAGQNYSVVVGSGGSSGNPGQNGGSSLVSLGSTTNVLAAGGGGASTTSTPGSGGTVANSIGSIRFAGGNAADGATDVGGGGGGSAFFNAVGGNGSVPTGGAGTGNGGNGGANTQPGQDGNAPGGGGGGRGQDGVNSGDGAPGQVILIYSVLGGVPSGLSFATSPYSVVNSNTSPVITITLQDTNDIPALATNNVTVNLSSSLAGVFRNAGDTANITTVVISNGQTSASFRYRPNVLGDHELTVSATGLISADQTLTSIVQPAIVQTYYVPYSEEDVQDGLTSINPSTDGTNVALISISAFASNTVVYYDHWEDGYEDDLANPTQSTTEVWGDLNLANGCPPNFTNLVVCTDEGDTIARGQAVVAINTMPSTPRNPANIFYDGRDKIGVTRPVAVTRFGWDVGPATLLAGSIEVFDTTSHGQEFRIPVGTNVVTVGSAYEYVMASIMPTREQTTIVVDFDNNGVPDLTTNLAVGATLALTNRIQAGTVVTSSAPIQVTLITGDIGSNFESRWYNIPPTEKWSSEYFNPVASVTTGVGRADVVLFNPNPVPLNVLSQYKTAADDIITLTHPVPAGSFFIVSNEVFDTAQYYYTTNDLTFFGIGFVDAEGSGQASDWGFSLVPESSLTPIAFVGSAPGRDPFSTVAPTTNVSPVWVTVGSPNATTVYIDYDGDGGAFTNECGEYDIEIDIAFLDSVRVYDPDGDQTAMKLFTCDGSLITAAWGQDPEIAPGGQPSLDLGYTVLPLPSIDTEKLVDFSPGGDLNGDGVLNPGEIIRYTIIVTNPNDQVSGGVTVEDVIPDEVIYITNSTLLDGSIPIADSGVTPFPLDEGGFFLGVLTSRTARTFTFDGSIIDPYLSDKGAITNRARVRDDVSTVIVVAEVASPVVPPTLIIEKTSDVGAFFTNSQVITYSISVVNTGTITQTGITVTDAVPAEVSFVPGSTLVTAPIQTGSVFTNSVRDDFSSANYGLNTGTVNWDGNWIEQGETTSPTAGDIQIVNGRLRLTNAGGNLPGIYREVDLSNAIEASISLRYEASNNLEVIDSAHLEISTNSGASYVILRDYTEIAGAESGTDTFDLTPYRSADTRIRFKIDSGYTGVDEFFRVDWVQVQFTTGVSARVTNTFSGGDAPNLHSGQTLFPGESMTITFEAVVTNSIVGVDDIINTACLTADGRPDPLCDSVTDLPPGPGGIRVDKTVSPDVFPGSESLTGTNGTPLVYWFVVSNTGEVTLTSVTLNDADIGFSTNLGTLAVGQVVTASAPDVLVASLTNTAVVSGNPPADLPPVTDEDTASVIRINPDILIEKTVSDDGTFAGSGNLVTGTNNQSVTYYFVVSNPGDVALTNVTLVDNDLTPPVNQTLGDLAVGQSVTVDVNSVISGSLTNIATATGEDPLGNPHDDDDDAEVRQLQAIRGNVFLDVNGDGLFDPEDITNGIAGVTVTLFDAISNVVGVTTTDVNGAYAFAENQPGVYNVVATDLPGYTSTADIVPPNDNVIPVTLLAGSDSNGNDFLDTLPGEIGDFVWNDLDGDGVQDPGEPGLSNLTVRLYDNQTNLIQTTTTDSDGLYAFTNVFPGTAYWVEFSPPPGFLFSPPFQGGDPAADSNADDITGQSDLIDLFAGEVNSTIDAGLRASGSISGSVFLDANGDGLFDPEDITNGITGVTITLLNSLSNVVGVTTTDVNGAYSFTDLPPDSYTVVQTDLPGFISTGDVVPPNDNQIPVVLTPGATVTGRDFLDSLPGSIGDFVWYDLNQDGIQDIDEIGLDNVVLRLLDNALAVVGITTSDVNGAYAFTGIPPGTYRVEVITPVGFAISPQGQGGDPGLDSDIDPLTTRTDPITLVADETRNDIDAGLYSFQNIAQIRSVSGEMNSAGPVLNWETDSEHGTAGWLIERSADGEAWTVVSDYLYGSGNAQTGARYAWLDAGVEPGSTVWYRLIEVETRGGRLVHGPYAVTYAGPKTKTSAMALSVGGPAYAIEENPLPPPAPGIRTLGQESVPVTGDVLGIRVAVIDAGLHRIPAGQLAAFFGVTEATIEDMPLRVEHLGRPVASSRDQGDILFPAIRHQSRYSDENIYFILPGDTQVLSTQPSAPQPGAVATSFADQKMWDPQTVFRADLVDDPEEDFWYWQQLISGSATRSQFTTTLNLPGLASGTGGELSIVLKGSSAAPGQHAHRARIELNGAVLGSMDVQGLNREELTFPIPPGLWQEAGNTLKVVSTPPPGVAFDSFYVDRVLAAYSRSYAASSPAFAAPVSAGTVEVTGLPGPDIDLWWMNDRWHAVRLTDAQVNPGSQGWTVRFNAPGDGDVALSVRGYELSAHQLTPMVANDLRDPGHVVDYLVIASSGLEAAAHELAADREAKGLATKVVDIQSVYDAFNHGLRDARALRVFLGYAYRNWTVSPRYVTLVGTGSLDYKNVRGHQDSAIPGIPAAGPFGVFPSDYAFADLAGNGEAEMIVGRIPAAAPSDVQAYLAKLSAYEQGGAWRDEVLIVSDAQDHVGLYAADASHFANALPGKQVHLAHADEMGVASARQQILDHFGEGLDLAVLIGHGSVRQFARSGMLTVEDVDGLSNQATPAVLAAFGCSMASFGTPGDIGIGMKLITSSAGAAAVIGSATPVNHTDSMLLGSAFMNQLQGQATSRWGDALAASAGAASAAGRSWVSRAYQLLGDSAVAVGDPNSPRALPAPAPIRPSYQEWVEWSFAPVWRDLGLSTAQHEDPDVNGRSNLDEYIAGTDPTKSESDFIVVSVEKVDDGRLVLSWASSPGRMYRIERAQAPDDGFDVVADGVPATPPANEFHIVESDPAGTSVFRIKVY